MKRMCKKVMYVVGMYVRTAVRSDKIWINILYIDRCQQASNCNSVGKLRLLWGSYDEIKRTNVT